MRKTLTRLVTATAFATALGTTPALVQAANFDYESGYDPQTGKPVVICVDCWFYSCDCRIIPGGGGGGDD